jgi:hypothetical protein
MTHDVIASDVPAKRNVGSGCWNAHYLHGFREVPAIILEHCRDLLGGLSAGNNSEL